MNAFVDDGWICIHLPLDTASSESGALAAAKFKNIGSLKNIPEKLLMRRGITMDSGAGANVIPRRMVNEERIHPSPGPLHGMFYVAADDGRIPNEGEVDLDFPTRAGDDQSRVFQIANANRALGSVADRVDHRCRVVYEQDDETGQDLSYI